MPSASRSRIRQLRPGTAAAAIALLRMHGYTNDRVLSRQSREDSAGLRRTGRAGRNFRRNLRYRCRLVFRPHTQVVVIGNDQPGQQLYAAAIAPFALNKSVIRMRSSERTSTPPTSTGRNDPESAGGEEGKSVAVVCSNFTCMPPIDDPDQLAKTLARGALGLRRNVNFW